MNLVARSNESETLSHVGGGAKGERDKAPEVGGVGGSYSNAVADSLLARLIHAEIRERHLRATAGGTVAGDVDYLGSFNVLYRRALLDEVGGFDESWVNGPGAPGAEDADLSYRIAALGRRLRLRADARVAHHHPVSLGSYLRAQRLHGFWGVRLYRRHPARGRKNSYSRASASLPRARRRAAGAGDPGRPGSADPGARSGLAGRRPGAPAGGLDGADEPAPGGAAGRRDAPLRAARRPAVGGARRRSGLGGARHGDAG